MSMEYIVDENKNIIHPTAVIHADANIGSFNFIGPYCTIHNNVHIGNYNIFESHVSVGSPAEHKAPEYNRVAHEQKGKVVIGNFNNIREFVTINKPTQVLTSIGSNCYIMRGGHISHDSHVEDDVIMSCDVILGGHTIVLKGAYMGIKSCTHPRMTIGHYSIIGMGSVVTKNITPGAKAFGIPAKIMGFNDIGLERAGLTRDDLNKYDKIYEETIK